MRPRIAVLLLLAASVACRSGGSLAPAEPPSLPDSTHWVRNSAEYAAAARQTYKLATERLEELAAGRQDGRWAVILDADETVLDNSQYQKELALAGASFSQQSWTAWCRRREAGSVPGSRAFLERVHALGGRIAIVTNRRQAVCADTEAVFRANELPFDVVLCRPDDGPGDKAPRWAMVTGGSAHPELPPLDVVMWLGDNIHDFPELSQELRNAGDDAFVLFGERYFVMPNPMYGSWSRNPED
jgi:5'-nucleotidase (lipoprotein e(P4) family)